MVAGVLLLGAIFGLGITTFVVALQPVEPSQALAARRRKLPTLATTRAQVSQFTMRLVAGLATGVVVGAITRWPMAALLLGLAAFMAPTLLGGGAERRTRLRRIEAIAGWAEMLRDTMAGSGGLEQSIIATAGVAPQAIRPEVVRMAALLERERLAPSLRYFADEVDDPAADLVVAALLLAADKSPKKLGDLLGRLAQSTRADVNMRMRIEASRARTRTSVRVITVFTVGFASFLVLFNRDYLDVYDSAIGQLVLGLVGACFAGAFYWLAQAFKIENEDRFLRTELETLRPGPVEVG
jgi:Flp pilus assembly protein TadB